MKKNKSIILAIVVSIMLQASSCLSINWISWAPDEQDLITEPGVFSQEWNRFLHNAPNVLREEMYKIILIKGILGIAIYLYLKGMPTCIQNVFNPPDTNSNSTPILHTKNSPQELIDQEKIEGEIELPDVMKDNLNKAREGISQNNIILTGPPGSGKSTFAKFYGKKLEEIIDREIIVYTIDPAKLVSKYWGGTTENITNFGRDADNETKRRLYQTIGRALGKIRDKFVIIILDELEALFVGQGGEQNHGLAASATMKNIISNIFDTNENIIFIGTTNHLGQIPDEITDRAEFEYIPEPNEERIENIIKSVIKSTYKEIYKRDMQNFETYMTTPIENEPDQTILSKLVDQTKGSGIRTLKKSISKTFTTAKRNNIERPLIEDYIRDIEIYKRRIQIKNFFRTRGPKIVDRLPDNFDFSNGGNNNGSNFKNDLEKRKIVNKNTQFDEAINALVTQTKRKESPEVIKLKEKVKTYKLSSKMQRLINTGKIKHKKNIKSKEI